MKRLLATTWLNYQQALSVELIYRYALVHIFVMSGVSLVGMLMFWVAVGRKGGADAAYSAPMLVAYFVVAALVGIIQENRMSFNLSAAIRMGKLSAAMLRPYPYLVGVVAQSAAQATVRLFLMVPLVAVLFTAVGSLRSVAATWTATQLGYFALASILALVIGWLIRIALGLLAFDMTQTWGPELIFIAVYSLASGINYPCDLLPAKLLAVVSWTPVYYMIGFPTLILLGRVSASDMAVSFERGLIVTVVMVLLVTLMWRRGVRRFEAVGI